MTDEQTLYDAEAVCRTLGDDEDGIRREVLTHAGSRWALGILHALGVNGRMRHAAIRRQMTGVTQRMLTKTLRAMERDGLVRRHEHGEVPPRVEYELTPLGMGLLVRMSPIWTWVVENADAVREARAAFDSHDGSMPPWQIPGR